MHRHLLALCTVAATVAGAAGCAATAPRARVATTAPAPAVDPNSPDASGTWDWMFRSTDGGHAPLSPSDSGGGDVRQASMQTSDTPPPVGGTWVWELRSIDAEGDERMEKEEWHLAENPDGVSGYYDRTVARVRGDGG